MDTPPELDHLISIALSGQNPSRGELLGVPINTQDRRERGQIRQRLDNRLRSLAARVRNGEERADLPSYARQIAGTFSPLCLTTEAPPNVTLPSRAETAEGSLVGVSGRVRRAEPSVGRSLSEAISHAAAEGRALSSEEIGAYELYDDADASQWRSQLAEASESARKDYAAGARLQSRRNARAAAEGLAADIAPPAPAPDPTESMSPSELAALVPRSGAPYTR